MSGGLMCVTASRLDRAADDLESAGKTTGVLRNAVVVTVAQLRRAATILAEGPQPCLRGHAPEEMPGFISLDGQMTTAGLTFQVGVLLSRTYVIARDGTVVTDSEPGA